VAAKREKKAADWAMSLKAAGHARAALSWGARAWKGDTVSAYDVALPGAAKGRSERGVAAFFFVLLNFISSRPKAGGRP